MDDYNTLHAQFLISKFVELRDVSSRVISNCL